MIKINKFKTVLDKKSLAICGEQEKYTSGRNYKCKDYQAAFFDRASNTKVPFGICAVTHKVYGYN